MSITFSFLTNYAVLKPLNDHNPDVLIGVFSLIWFFLLFYVYLVIMKKYIFIFALGIGMILSACGTKSGSATKETKDSTKVEVVTDTLTVKTDTTNLK